MTTVFVVGKSPCSKKFKGKLHLPWIKTRGIGPIKCYHVFKMGPSTSCRVVINQLKNSHKLVAEQS
jgi:hypothetical protein